MISSCDLSHVEECEIWSNVISDHSFVYLRLAFEQFRKGPGLWKFNTSLLYDSKYVTEMRTQIEQVIKQNNYMDPSDRWEVTKLAITEFMQWYAKKLAVDTKMRLTQLAKRLNSLYKRLGIINLSSDRAVSLIQNISNKIDKTKIEINEIESCKTRGAMLKAKVQWMQEAGHNTKYFLNLEKSRAKNKTMMAVRLENGIISRNSNVIVEKQKEFYKRLYTSDPSVKFHANNLSHIQITVDQKHSLELPISKQEIWQALKDTQRNKTPGQDGIPADFYMVFWAQIGQVLYEAFVDSIQKSRLFASARRGVIPLIPKKGCDPLEVKNWCLLLNADYKLLLKAISSRLKVVLTTIIHEDQNGFIPGRNITHNIRKAMDITRYAHLKKIDAMILSVDFEKAFDRVEYQAMIDIFWYFGIGEFFCKLVNLLFTDFQLAVSNAANLSTYITPSQGLFQGNPISSFTFVIIIEILVINLRSSTSIDSIEIKGIKYLLSQFADDLDLFMKTNSHSLREVLHIITEFGKISGMKINLDKTTLYRIGSCINSNAKFYSQLKIRWSTKPLNILGVFLSNDQDEMFQLNYNEIINEIMHLYTEWQTYQ